jgi:hypothetical protein
VYSWCSNFSLRYFINIRAIIEPVALTYDVSVRAGLGQSVGCLVCQVYSLPRDLFIITVFCKLNKSIQVNQSIQQEADCVLQVVCRTAHIFYSAHIVRAWVRSA